MIGVVQIMPLHIERAVAIEENGAVHAKLAASSLGVTVAVPIFPTTTPAA